MDVSGKRKMREKFRKAGLLILAVLVLSGSVWVYRLLDRTTDLPQLPSTTVARRELKSVVNTNGIIEPTDLAEIYSPIDASVASIRTQEGSEVTQGQVVIRLESAQIATALAEARASLLQARRQALQVTIGASKEELTAADAAIAECEMQLGQVAKDLRTEESLLGKGATTRVAVEGLQKQRDLLELRRQALKQKKQDLLARYSAEERQWEQDRVRELTRQVESLEQQVREGSVLAPRTGVLYALSVKAGSYVTKGQLLARVYTPGNVWLRAYVDEPDLGRIGKGQEVVIEWDGLPDRHWTGRVESPAKQVVALGNRSVGYVMCAIDDGRNELIPSINVKVQIVTARKANALVVPRTVVFNHNGQPAVTLLEGTRTTVRPVVLGLVTPEEVEILRGLDEGNTVVANTGQASGAK
jgi:HlyD family secretion protein